MAQFNKTVRDIRINFSASNNFLKKIKKKKKGRKKRIYGKERDKNLSIYRGINKREIKKSI